MRIALFAYLILGLLLFSCGGKKDQAAGDAKPVQDTVGVDLAINPTDSKVNWVGYKATGKHTGTINIKSGSVTLRGGNVVGGKFVIDMNSINVTDLKDKEKENLEKHLKGQDADNDKVVDFFRVDSFPEATFEITSIAPEQKDSTTHKVDGNLTLNGKTKSISFPAKIEMPDSNTVKAKGTAKVMRKDFGITFHSKEHAGWWKEGVAALKDQLINDEFDVIFEIVAKK